MTTAAPSYLQRLLQTSGSATDPPVPSYLPVAAERREIAWPLPAEALDADACSVVRRLAGQGFHAYLVGGCVRDLLFGLRPKDFDVATSATPREIKRIFRNSRIIGRRFRLAHVFFRDKIIEVATFRAAAPGESEQAVATPDADVELTSNGEQTDALIIRDDNVFGTAEQDAVRRDFTCNALFYDVERETIIDFVGGVADVEQKTIRTIGDPYLRMREDPIRMLRALRLAARLGCQIDPVTWAAIELHHAEILHAASPRIQEDVLRMFRGGAAAPAVDTMIASGVLETILPELYRHLAQEVRVHGSDEIEALRQALLVADAWTHSGRLLSDPAYLALLLAPTMLTPVYDAHGRGGSAAAVLQVAEMMKPISIRWAISKRDSERIRQILLTLSKLIGKSRRRRNTGALIRRNFFPDALDVLEIYAHATGDLLEDVARWRRRVEEQSAGEVREERHPRRTRRRRRNGGPPERPSN